MNPSIGTKLGKYEIGGVIGSGAMSIVYDGWDPLISRRVAIKTVRLEDTSDEEVTEGLARFRREAQAAGRLSHPNIVSIYDYGESNEHAYIVMEFVEGNSLQVLLDSRKRLPIEETVRIVEELLAGLQFSHDRGVIHRDVKPANVMLTMEGRVKIADFGIARIQSSNTTQVGVVIGTPAYMSPEQLLGQVVDARTDIYSSGVLLYRMLTGKRPFEGTTSGIMQKVTTTGPPRLSEFPVGTPPRFDAVVARAMARLPGDRFSSAAEFARSLRAAFEATTAERRIAAMTGGDDVDRTVPAGSTRVARGTVALPLSGAATETLLAKHRRKLRIGKLGGVIAVFLIAAGVGTWFGLQPSPTAPVAAEALQKPGKFAVFFPAWSAALDDKAEARIITAAQWAKQHPAEGLTVIGFAAPDGSREANTALSETRAQLVMDELARDGVAPTRMRLAAHGATDVKASLSEGRRVEIDFGRP